MLKSKSKYIHNEVKQIILFYISRERVPLKENLAVSCLQVFGYSAPY